MNTISLNNKTHCRYSLFAFFKNHNVSNIHPLQSGTRTSKGYPIFQE